MATQQAPDPVRGRSALRAWRAAQGLSQQQAAGPLGLHQASWSDWENGKKTPAFELAAKIELLTKGRVRVEDFGYDPAPALGLGRSSWRSAEAKAARKAAKAYRRAA